MNEREAVSALVKCLKAHGYPEESILVGGSVPDADGARWLTPDVLIVEPKGQRQLAVFEVKRGGSDLENAVAVAQLNLYRQAVENALLQAYLVVPGEDELTFHRVASSGELVEMSEGELPKFAALRANKLSLESRRVEQKKTSATDVFRWACWLLASLGLIIFILDFVLSYYGANLLTAERLVVLGGAAALFVLPHAAKLRALGLEWERLPSDGDEG